MSADRWNSAVWDYFERVSDADGSRFSRCKECGLQLKGHAASNNKRHLMTVHNIVDPTAQDEQQRTQNPSIPRALNNALSHLNEKKEELLVEIASRSQALSAGAGYASFFSPHRHETPRPLTDRTYLQDLEQRRTRRREQTRRNVYNYRCKVTGKRNQLKATSHEVEEMEKALQSGKFGTLIAFNATKRVRTASTGVNDGRNEFLRLPVDARALPTHPLVTCEPLLDADRIYSIHSFVRMFRDIVSVKGSLLLAQRTAYGIHDIEYMLKDAPHFMETLMANVPLWRTLETLGQASINLKPSFKRGIFVDAPIKWLYTMMLEIVGMIFSTVAGRLNYRIAQASSELGRYGRKDTPRDPLYVAHDLRTYWSDMTTKMHWRFAASSSNNDWLQTIYKCIQPHENCADDIILDLFLGPFQKNIPAAISFTYYEKCAAVCPSLRRVIEANIYRFRRELVDKMTIFHDTIVMQREWDFDDETGRTYNYGSCFTTQLPLDAIRRYEANTTYIQFGDDADSCNFLDFLDPVFMDQLSYLKSEYIILQGFSACTEIGVHEVENATDSLRLIHSSACSFHFRLTRVHHLAALMGSWAHNAPAVKGSHEVELSLDEGAQDGSILAKALCSICMHPEQKRLYVTVHCVGGIDNAELVIVPLIQAFTSGHCELVDCVFNSANISRSHLEELLFCTCREFITVPTRRCRIVAYHVFDKFGSYVDHFYVCQRSDGMYCGVYADIDNRFLWVFVKELFFSVERPPSRLTNVALEALRIDQQTSDMIAYIM